MRQIYLDYNATTPIAPSVIDAMNPFLHDHYGNPSSAHSLGRAAKEGIEDARAKVAALLACDPSEVIFTSGGTESNNLAIKGVMFKGAPGSGHMIISSIEHPAVSEPAFFLQRMGYDVSIVGCDENGVVRPADIEKELRADTRLVSVMHANNEIGTIQPIREIAEICHSHGVLVHTDAAQSVGKVAICIDQLDVDMLTVAGHKLYGPKGVGALYVRDGLELEPALHGAKQENGVRAGTENAPYIVGLGHAASLSAASLDEAYEAMSLMRDRLDDLLVNAIPDLKVNGQEADRLPNTLSVSLPGVSGQEVLKRVPELCASTGSACHSSGVVSSSTLDSMGCDADHVAGTIRLSVGWHTSDDDIERGANLLIDAWENLSTAGK